jgi:type I restriction enzyme M protein
MLFLKVYDAKEEDWKFADKSYASIIPEECRWLNWAHDDRSGSAMTGDTLLDFVNNTLFPTLKKLEVTKDTTISKSIVKTTFEDANQYMKDGVLLRQVINVIDDLDLSDYNESHAFGDIYESILRELQSAGSSGEFYTPRAVTDFMAKMIHPEIGLKMADFACGTGGFLTSWLKELSKCIKTTGDQKSYNNSIYGIEKKQFPYMLCITNMLLHGIDIPRIYHDNSLTKKVLDYTDDDKFDIILMNPPYGGSEKNDIKNNFPSDLASSETADLFMSVIMYRLKKNGRAAVILPDGFLFGTDNAKVAIKKKLLSEFNLHTVIRMPHSVFAPYTSITTNILFFDNTEPTTETWFYRLDMPDGYKNFSKTKPVKLEHFASAMEWWNNREEINIDGFDKSKKYTLQELVDRNYNIDLCGYPHEEEEILPPKELIQQYQEKRASLNADIDRVLAQITDILGIDLLEVD